MRSHTEKKIYTKRKKFPKSYKIFCVSYFGTRFKYNPWFSLRACKLESLKKLDNFVGINPHDESPTWHSCVVGLGSTIAVIIILFDHLLVKWNHFFFASSSSHGLTYGPSKTASYGEARPPFFILIMILIFFFFSLFVPNYNVLL